jgi:hypothetical protein
VAPFALAQPSLNGRFRHDAIKPHRFEGYHKLPCFFIGSKLNHSNHPGWCDAMHAWERSPPIEHTSLSLPTAAWGRGFLCNLESSADRHPHRPRPPSQYSHYHIRSLLISQYQVPIQPGLTPIPPRQYLPPSPIATALPRYPLTPAMATLIYIELVNSMKSPKCGYNNITGKKTCEGTLADGSTCGAKLPIVLA